MEWAMTHAFGALSTTTPAFGQKRSKITGTLAVACFVLAVTCGVAAADAMDDCHQGRPGINIAACTAIITGQSFGPNEKALAYNYRGNALVDAGENQRAIADFTEAIRLNKDNTAAFAGRGRANFAIENLAGAIADYSEAIRLSPATADLYVQRGHVYIVSNQLDAAISDLTQAIKLNPSSAQAFNARGAAYDKKKDFDKAIADYTSAIALFPFPAIYANRGYAYEAQNRPDLAIADLQYALLHDPSQIGAKDALKRLGVPVDAVVTKANQLVHQGATLAETSCSGCHAVGMTGDSPNKSAVEFRNYYQNQPLFELRQPITRAIRETHDKIQDEKLKEMKATLTDQQIDAIVAYINSLSTAKRLGNSG
jgi:tetratricopeptide (TPR) repeat protein